LQDDSTPTAVLGKLIKSPFTCLIVPAAKQSHLEQCDAELKTCVECPINSPLLQAIESSCETKSQKIVETTGNREVFLSFATGQSTKKAAINNSIATPCSHPTRVRQADVCLIFALRSFRFLQRLTDLKI